jgi:hypothetical protein
MINRSLLFYLSQMILMCTLSLAQMSLSVGRMDAELSEDGETGDSDDDVSAVAVPDPDWCCVLSARASSGRSCVDDTLHLSGVEHSVCLSLGLLP